jgi:hypothetical protein
MSACGALKPLWITCPSGSLRMVKGLCDVWRFSLLRCREINRFYGSCSTTNQLKKESPNVSVQGSRAFFVYFKMISVVLS